MTQVYHEVIHTNSGSSREGYCIKWDKESTYAGSMDSLARKLRDSKNAEITTLERPTIIQDETSVRLKRPLSQAELENLLEEMKKL